MRRMHRVVLLAGLVALAPVLSGCEDFDMDKFDVFGFNQKKKLPGERKELFPQGVPGVSQGIPPEYLKGNQPPPETAQGLAPDGAAATAEPKTAAPAAKTAAVEPEAEPKPKAKPKRKPKSRTAATPAQPAASTQDSGQQQMAPWPATAPQQPAAQSGTATAPWPSDPPSR